MSTKTEKTDLDLLLHDLVVANRILANEGVVDAFGHISLRHPDHPDRFFISRSLGPELVTEADLQEFTLDGTQVGGERLPPYAERAIHGAVYEARPEVVSICHNHAPSVIPFGTTGVRLRPIFHVGGMIGNDVPVWEPSDEFGDTDMLVRDLDQGRSLARRLGSARVALMRGHGAVVTGATIRETVIRSVYMLRNAELQLAAESLAPGKVRYLSEGETERTKDWAQASLSQDRAWGTFAARAGFPLQT